LEETGIPNLIGAPGTVLRQLVEADAGPAAGVEAGVAPGVGPPGRIGQALLEARRVDDAAFDSSALLPDGG
jgi:hypothetical protein